MKNNKQLINNLIGQLSGIQKMMDEKRDCLEVIAQVKAVKAGLENVMGKIILASLEECATKGADPKKKERLIKLIGEAVKK